MSQIKLNFLPDSLETTSSGNVLGIVYFSVGSNVFPEARWYDFIVVVLHWWLIAMDELQIDNKSSQKLRFMDGEQYVNVNVNDAEYCTIEFFNSEKDEFPEFSAQQQNINEFYSSIYSVATKVVELVEAREWVHNDIEILKNLLKRSDCV